MKANILYFSLSMGYSVLFFITVFTLGEQNNTLLHVNQTRTNGQILENIEPNENLIVKTLLHNKWLDIASIHNSSYKQLRKALISEIAKRLTTSPENLIQLSDAKLSSIGLTYRFLLDAEIKTTEELNSMSFQGLKQSVIRNNATNSAYTISSLKLFSWEKNLRIAHQWSFPKKNSGLISKINRVDAKTSFYKLKDNTNKKIEVLRIVQVNETDYKYLGVYHRMVGRNHFKLFLAGSNDSKNWDFITNLGERSHQGAIKKWGKGYLLVNEEDIKEGSNNIRVRFYQSYHDLCMNKSIYSKAIPRKFSKYAEGTPDIREIIGESPHDSYILLGFHYYNNGDVDYQAMGILKNFSHWRAWKDEVSNNNILKMGYKGNIGARSAFMAYGKNYVILEAQYRKKDFSSWQLLLGDGAFYTLLNLKTSENASSFANPGVCTTTDNNIIVTTFLPTEGNSANEKGQLLYVIKIN